MDDSSITCYHTIKDKNLDWLVFRLAHKFQINTDRIIHVIRALNQLHHHDFDHYAILSEVYGDPAEEHHRRYDHVSPLFDIIARGALATESWRDNPHPIFFSNALGVLGQAILLQKSVEQEQGAQSLVDFNKVCEEFELYFSENKNIPIDLQRVELRLSGNSASLSAPLAPRILKSSELMRLDHHLTEEGRRQYFQDYYNALNDACSKELLKEGDYKDIGDYMKSFFYSHR